MSSSYCSPSVEEFRESTDRPELQQADVSRPGSEPRLADDTDEVGTATLSKEAVMTSIATSPRLDEQLTHERPPEQGSSPAEDILEVDSAEMSLKSELDSAATKDDTAPTSTAVSSRRSSVTSNPSRPAANANGSDSSSGSVSTVTRRSWIRPSSSRGSATAAKSRERRSLDFTLPTPTRARPDVMSFLQSDSSPVAQEATQRGWDDGSPWRLPSVRSRQSPSGRSTSSSASTSSFISDVFSAQDTDGSMSSPNFSTDGNSPVLVTSMDVPSVQRAYGTPEMPRGNTDLPHIPPNDLQSRGSASYQTQPVYLPRAEKLPMTGYELLASKLSSGHMGGPTIKPMYRRFEALNHRLLLHLQDELEELEEQLHRFDTTDTQNRRLQNGFLPASRRQEAATGSELQWLRTDILGKIGFKLGQYNQVLSSFKSTQSLPSPNSTDVERYRNWLLRHSPIVEAESHYLDQEDDLVSAARPPILHHSEFNSEDLKTPMPRSILTFPPTPSSPATDSRSPPYQVSAPQVAGANDHVDAITSDVVPKMMIAASAALLLPTLLFLVIPGLVGRMAVVLLVGFAVYSALLQSGVALQSSIRSEGMAGQEWLYCAAMYVPVMSVLACVV